MLPLPYTADQYAAALARVDAGDAIGSTARNVGSREQRARGHLAEPLISAWLDENGIRHTRHGGVDLLPDVELASGHTLGIRFCGRTYDPWHSVVAWAEHLRCDSFAFVGHRPTLDPLPWLWLLGFAPRERLEDGRLVPAGETVVPGYIAERDTYAIKVDELDHETHWLKAREFEALLRA